MKRLPAVCTGLALLCAVTARARAPAPGPLPSTPATPPPAAARAPALTAQAPDPWSSKWLVLGLGIGMGFPQPFSRLRNFGVYGLEVGFLLPFWGRRLQLGGMFTYSEPGSGKGDSDPRLGAGGDVYRWDLTQREYVLEVFHAQVRFFPIGTRVNPYGRFGVRVYLLDTVANGTAVGTTFGQYNERFTEAGFSVAGGLEVRAGPGAFHFELRVDWSNMDRRISGDSNTGMLTLFGGYRFLL